MVEADGQEDSQAEQTSRPSEIVVTAQRSEQQLQDVPISISVLEGEKLDRSRVQGLTEILRTVPGVSAPISALGTPTISIRGVAPSGLAFAGASPAAVYFDSAPYGFIRNALAPDADIYDLERIEVLRGPQGTLFGANAQSGVVRILTHDPVLSDFDFKARGSISDTRLGGTNYRGDMAVNLPIVEDRLAARAVVGYHNRSGWIDKPGNPDADDAQISNMRLKVKAQPTDELSIVATSLFNRNRASSQSIGMDGGINIVANDEPVNIDTDQYGVEIEYEFPSFMLTSSTNHLTYDIASSLDISFFFPQPAEVIQTVGFKSRVISQEVYLTSNDRGTWRWSVGGSYRDVKDLFTRNLGGPSIGSYTDFSQSWAVFGELTKVLLDGKLEVTGGLRYFEDKQRTRENISSSGNPMAPLVNAEAKFDALTPRVVLTWLPNDDLTVYGSYSQGFRSGLNQSPEVLFAVPGFGPVEPDRLHNYEVGAKGRLLGGLVSFDAAAYYLDLQDVQQSLIVVTNGVTLNPVLNAGSASGPGFEIATTLTPARGLALAGSFSWNDLTFDQDVFSGGGLLFPKGSRLNQSAEYTAGGSVSYDFPISRGFEGQLSFSGNYTSAVKNDSNPANDGDSITILRTSFSLYAPENWTATMFIDNITNDIDPTVRFDAFGLSTWNGLNTRPRTIGLMVEYKY